MNPINKQFDDVYYVESPNSSGSVNPVAIRPRVNKNRIEWEDTSRGTVVYTDPQNIKIKGDDAIPRKIEIVDRHGTQYILRRLTLELFNERVKNKVAGNPEFSSEDELIDYYKTTVFD